MLYPVRSRLPGSLPIHHPFGKTKSRDVLEEFCPTLAKKVCRVLFLSSGDLYKALHTAAGLISKNSNTSLQLDLNDACSNNVARNILLLKIISQGEFHSAEDICLDYLWEVWYKVTWKEATKQLFMKDVEELISGVFPESIDQSSLSDQNIQILKTIWNGWLDSGLLKFTHFSSNTKISTIDEEIMSEVINQMGITDFPEQLKIKICRECITFYYLKEFANNGSAKREPAICCNPTLFDPKSMDWLMDFTLCPVISYLPLELEELDTTVQDDVVVQQYCQKRLKCLLQSYQKRKGDIKFAFHLRDPLELCYEDCLPHKFDVIDCSTLADVVGLANIMNAAGRVLSDEPESLMLNETSTWHSLAPSLTQYVEEALCAPLSILPTMYGLRLTNLIQQEPSSSTFLEATLIWRRTPRYENLFLDVAPSLGLYFNKLAKKCLPDQFTPGEQCGMKFYTPLTLVYILRSAAERLGRGYDDFLAAFPDFMSPRYNLFIRTLRYWTSLAKFSLMASRMNFASHQTERIQQALSLAPCVSWLSTKVPLNSVAVTSEHSVLCLLLVPLTDFPNFTFNQSLDIPASPDIHFVDNVRVQFFRNTDTEQVEGVEVSFPLVSNHGLEDTHCGVVIDLLTAFPLIYIGQLNQLRIETFAQFHPFCDGGVLLPEVVDGLAVLQGPHIRVDSCMETEDQYVVLIRIVCEDNVEGFSFTTDRQLPGESAHRITLGFDRPFELPPLTLTFPHPFVADTASVKVEIPLLSIRVVLLKAVQEPWPGDFTSRARWNAEELKVWRFYVDQNLKMIKDSRELFFHLEQQFPRIDITKEGDVWSQVCLVISALFELHLKDGFELITIRRSNDRDRLPDWWLRIHSPVRSTPYGAPILIMSAYDQVSAERLLFKGKLDKDKDVTDIQTIFIDAIKSPTASLVISKNEEVAQFLRYVLRLNSTKISHTQWQKNHLPRGKNSPWLVTFVSPLYFDRPRPLEHIVMDHALGPPCSNAVEAPPVPLPSPSAQDYTCACCGKVSSKKMKRCGRCTTTLYCCIKCQRADSFRHQSVCPNLSKTRRA